jgi:hypothetical protein
MPHPPIAPNPLKNELEILFNEYTVFYYSQSSTPWEAAFINCFQKTGGKEGPQVGRLVFTYPEGTTPTGQEHPATGLRDSSQVNRIIKVDTIEDFFVLYYDISRFNDVINLLQNCKNVEDTMRVTVDKVRHTWSLVHIKRMPLGNHFK